MNGLMVMNADLLLKNRDEQVLDNYLKLLAFAAQKTNSNHALMALKLENSDLKQQLHKSLSKTDNVRDELNDLKTTKLPIHVLKSISYLERLLR
jgi:hypothetical protein